MVEALILGLLLATMCGSIYAYPVPAVGSESGLPGSSEVSISMSALSPWAIPDPAAPPFSYSYSVDGGNLINGDNNGDSDIVSHNSASASIISNGSSIPVLASSSSSSSSSADQHQDEGMPVRNERSTNQSTKTFSIKRCVRILIMDHQLQISPDGVVNGTFENSKYTILQRIGTERGQVLIQGVETCLYLCMDCFGYLYGSRKASNECVFNEIPGEDNYNTYSSTKYSNSNRTLYIALNRSGQPRKVLLRANHSLGRLAMFTRALPRKLEHEHLPVHLRHNHGCMVPGPLSCSLDTNQRLQPESSSNDATALSNGFGAGIGNANGLAPSHSPTNHLQCRRRRWRRKKKRRKQPHSLPQSNTRLINSSNINDSSITNVKCSNSNSADGNNEECQRKNGSRGQANRKWRRGKGMPRKKMQSNNKRSGVDVETYSIPATEGPAISMPVASPMDGAEEDVGDSSTQVDWDDHDTTSHTGLFSDVSPDLQADILEDSSAIMTHPD